MSGLTQVILLVSFLIYVTPGFSPSALAVDNMNDTSQGSHDVSLSGTVSSNPDVFHNSGLEQSFFIFPIKNESTTYSGVLTFTSSKPVQIQSLNILTINNSLKLPVKFGTLYTFPVNDTTIITTSLLDEPKNTGSVQFSGNGLRIITNEPFLVSYSFSGKEFYSIIKNDIESA
ncbi:MAG: hypothetical protein L0H55_15950, partial [Candidatus Nitrosocosmicus sp.]|nr:hypothetical protein [Candidatus Nitrosocosmicus sp.]